MAKATKMSDIAAQFLPLIGMSIIIGAVVYVVSKRRQQQAAATDISERQYPVSNRFACPTCQSDNIAKVSLVVSNATKSFSASTVGVGMGAGGGIGVGGAGTTGASQSMTAQNLSPPAPMPIKAAMLGIIIGFFFALHDNTVVGVTVLVISLAALVRAWRFNNRTLPALMAVWNELYLCQRCATVFKIKQ